MIALRSNTLADVEVPNGTEWQYQRVQLLQNVHGAVKEVQIYITSRNDISTPLQAKDFPVENLCKQLDLILLHGLRNMTAGYWYFVREFTSKDDIENILNVVHIQTNIGRGRVWLRKALNDNLLGCYARSFIANPVLLKLFYTENAFLRDHHKLDMLCTLLNGIECAVFRLEYDLWFLDQNSVPPVSLERHLICKEPSVSSISLSSSIKSQQSTISFDSATSSQETDARKETWELEKLKAEEEKEVSRVTQARIDERIARLLKMSFPPTENSSKSEDGMETIEVTPQPVRRKMKKAVKTNTIKSRNILCTDTTSTEADNNNFELDVISLVPERTTSSISTPADDNIPVNSNFKLNFPAESFDEKINNYSELNSNCLMPSDKAIKLDCIEMKSGIKLREKSDEKKNPAKRVSFEIDLVANDVNMNFYSNSSSVNVSESNIEQVVSSVTPDIAQAEVSFPVEKSIYDGNCDCKKTKCFRTIYNGLIFELDEVKASDQCRNFNEKMKEEMKQMKNEKSTSYSIKVDNNTKLKLMLHVFRDEDEQLFKMFYACIGHSDDEMKLVFPVLTDRRVYFIEHGLCQRYYFVSKAFKYDELDYLLVGLNYQTILFVCKHRRKRYMLSTGDENLTRDIVSNLEVAVRRSSCRNCIPSVFTHSKMQQIGLEKWIANETNVERHTVNILYYGFVHWEDPLTSFSLYNWQANPSIHGNLMYRFYYRDRKDILLETPWTPGYFILRDGVLYQFSIEDGTYKLQTYLRLHKPDFLGCRKISKCDRPHVFELKLDAGRFLQLGASDDRDVSRWRQTIFKMITLTKPYLIRSLYNIISRIKFKNTIGEEMEEDMNSLKSCCLVLTPEKLLVCKEDLDLFSCTTLGSADLVNLSEIYVDASEPKYCILEFDTLEANVFVAGDWALYFSTEFEYDKFFTALAEAREKLLQVSITKTEIVDKSIQKKCRDRVMMLQNSWKLGYDMIREPISIIESFPSPK